MLDHGTQFDAIFQLERTTVDGHANLLIFNGNLLPEVDPSDSLEWLNLRNLRFSLFFHVEPCFIFLEA
jgi:hypothetical protein